MKSIIENIYPAQLVESIFAYIKFLCIHKSEENSPIVATWWESSSQVHIKAIVCDSYFNNVSYLVVSEHSLPLIWGHFLTTTCGSSGSKYLHRNIYLPP